jgi:hypothetical protein
MTDLFLKGVLLTDQRSFQLADFIIRTPSWPVL